MSTEKRTVAFFDFDGTLTTGDTLLPFLKFVVGKSTYYRKLIQNSPILAAYAMKLVSNNVAKEAVLKSYLSDYPLEKLREQARQFSKDVIPAMLRAEGMERLKWHQEQGHTCVLVSASLDLYLSYWCDDNNFDALLCTPIQEGFFNSQHPDVMGKNCFGEEKVNRIKEWSAPSLMDDSYAYGDSKGDTQMIAYVKHGYMLRNNVFNRK